MSKKQSSTELYSKTMLSIGVVGSRSLAYTYAQSVGQVVEDLLSRNFHIASGGAIGTDQFVIEKLLHNGQSDKGVIYSAWRTYKGFPVKVRAMHRQFKTYGGSIIWGESSGKQPAYMVKSALLGRNVRLVEACYGMVFFLTAGSRGSIFTLTKAIKEKMPIVIFPVECELPNLPHIKWRAIRCGGCWEGSYKVVYLR